MNPQEMKRRLEELRKKKSVTARELLPLLEGMVAWMESAEPEYANKHVEGDLRELGRRA